VHVLPPSLPHYTIDGDAASRTTDLPSHPVFPRGHRGGAVLREPMRRGSYNNLSPFAVSDQCFQRIVVEAVIVSRVPSPECGDVTLSMERNGWSGRGGEVEDIDTRARRVRPDCSAAIRSCLDPDRPREC